MSKEEEPMAANPSPSSAVPLVDPKQSQEPGEEPKALTGTALCLSGGGYRAMLFHVGSLWRLNEAGWLPRLDRISSVSGGSITAGVLGLHWGELGFDGANGKGVAANFQQALVDPIRGLAGETIDAGAVLGGIFGRGSVSDHVADAYRKHLFDHKTLQDLPDHPRFVINATNIQSGALCRFSKPFLWDYRVGKIANPKIELAVAVGASSAFPPVLSPVELDLSGFTFEPNTGDDLQRPPFTTKMVLSDGGVYDNMGIETAWKCHKTLLVSDGGAKMSAEEHPKSDWLRHSVRVLDVIDNQVRSLRKRQLIAAFKSKSKDEHDGTYWGIVTNIADYQLADALDCPFAKSRELAEVATRLSAVPDRLQERLINWGYAVCDAALRKHVDPTTPKPKGFPYAGGIG
jgi:NTE family protein